MTHVSEIVGYALAQVGDRYVFGAEAAKTDPDPDAWDCSELVEWACHRAGVAMVDGSKNQLRYCQQAGVSHAPRDGLVPFGFLLFRMTGSPTHVAISLGDGRTIEARGSDYGVGIFNARGRGWTHAATIPGVEYGPGPYTHPEELVQHDEMHASLKGAANHIAQELERRTNLLDADLEAVKLDLKTVSLQLHRVEALLLQLADAR